MRIRIRNPVTTPYCKCNVNVLILAIWRPELCSQNYERGRPHEVEPGSQFWQPGQFIVIQVTDLRSCVDSSIQPFHITWSFLLILDLFDWNKWNYDRPTDQPTRRIYAPITIAINNLLFSCFFFKFYVGTGSRCKFLIVCVDFSSSAIWFFSQEPSQKLQKQNPPRKERQSR